MEGFLLGCFLQLYERNFNAQTHFIEPQGKLKNKKERFFNA